MALHAMFSMAFFETRRIASGDKWFPSDTRTCQSRSDPLVKCPTNICSSSMDKYWNGKHAGGNKKVGVNNKRQSNQSTEQDSRAGHGGGGGRVIWTRPTHPTLDPPTQLRTHLEPPSLIILWGAFFCKVKSS